MTDVMKEIFTKLIFTLEEIVERNVSHDDTVTKPKK